ncbi:MAG: coenzyme A pyrophosphatase [Phototrophicales bacterium]|nr:MAG: coenzyme A pyrophosphatase [Phototrophicales bacterium]
MYEENALSLAAVQAALALKSFDVYRAQTSMAPLGRRLTRASNRTGTAKEAAVLVLLYPHPIDLHLVLIRRNTYNGVHSDQIGLPGGKREYQETFLQAALRETEEELGVSSKSIQLIGNLTPIYIPPSDYIVHPFVGYVMSRPIWIPDPKEVVEVIETPLAILLDDTIKQHQHMNIQGITVRVPYYNIQGHQVWGATAVMLSELEGRLRFVLHQNNH